ncbi:MAG: ribosome biogenesis GTPase Der [Hyphomicrobiales bacterium]|nr:MAG: ribosome biogenesis GTPase Der [Hyphomicrobiales bacterium]
MTFTLAIVGRPNVGKSTLFNRLVGKRLALVDDTPGVTRDRRMGEGHIGDMTFNVIDTAGLEEASEESLQGRMRAQTDEAIKEADVCLFVVDAKSGLTPADTYFSKILRKSGKPVILAANKAEGKSGDAGFYDAFSLGFGEPLAISAEHGVGMADLFSALLDYETEHGGAPEPDKRQNEFFEDDADTLEFDGHGNLILPEDDGGEDFINTYDEEKPLRVAIVGRPNAGKSTLINSMIGEERLLTGPEAGITRDSISVDWQWQDRAVRLFDTAGMRRKARVQEKLEKLSVADALRAIQYAETVVVIIDVTMPFEKQDLQIIDWVEREGRALVIALNKWDLVEDRNQTMLDLREKTDRLLPQIRGVPLVPISGLLGQGIDRLMKAVSEVDRLWNIRVSTAKLNRWLFSALEQHAPPAAAGRRIRIRYATQAKSRPPTFIVWCSRPDALPESYSRYLVNDFRQTFNVPSVPIRMIMRKGENPYAKKKKRNN